MSDLDDELYALAEGTSNNNSKSKRKSSSSKSKSTKQQSNKRKKSNKIITPAYVDEDDSASDMDMSGSDEEAPLASSSSRKGKNTRADDDSEDGEDYEDEDDEGGNEFPLEGKYKNSADKAEIKGMSELDRERVLGERAEQAALAQSRKDLRKMVQAKERGGKTASRTTTRDRTTTGASKTKTDTLAKLRQKRMEKGKKKSERPDSDDYDNEKDRSADEDSDRGDDREEEDSYEAPSSSKKGKGDKKKTKEVEELIPQNLRDVIVTRERMSPLLNAPWFGEWIKGAWVRYLVGLDHRFTPPQNTYRIANVIDVREGRIRPYKVEAVTTDKEFKLQIGDAPFWFTLEGTSNSPPTDKEIHRVIAVAADAGFKLPTAKALAEVKKNLNSRKEYVMSEADLAAHLAKKGSKVNPFQSKAKLLIQRDFARSSDNPVLLAETEALLAKLEPVNSNHGAQKKETESDRMMKVNERNRAKDREEIKKYEAKNMEERRKMAESLRRGDAVKIDASARVKTMTRLTYDRASEARPAASSPGTPNGSNTPSSSQVLNSTPLVDAQRTKSAFDKMVTDSVDVDVDLDF